MLFSFVANVNAMTRLFAHHAETTGVGFYNHKFFVSFIIYAFLGCTFVAVVGFPAFLHAIGEGPGRVAQGAGRGAALRRAVVVSSRAYLQASRSSGATRELSAMSSALLVIGYILTAAFSFALAIFVLFHAYLVARGRTTIEMYDIVDPVRATRIAGYDLGWRENVRLVFGNNKWHWPLPTRFGIEGDGLYFNRSNSAVELSEGGAV